jgi:glycosyltransferase involved in cell wall biosynthesis
LSKKQQILIIYPGPIQDIEFRFKAKLIELGKYFSGHLIATGWKNETIAFDDFKVITVKLNSRFRMISDLKLFLMAFTISRLSKQSNDPVQLVVSFDPVKTGAIAVILKLFFRHRVILEINGDIDNNFNYGGDKLTLIERFKKWIFLTLAKFNMFFCDGVKVLHQQQLVPFNRKNFLIEKIPDYRGLENFKFIKKEKEILLVGSPLFLKGADILLRAWQRIYEKYPDWQLKIIGYAESNDAIVEQIKACPRAFYCKAQFANDIVNSIGSTGIFVLPSRTEAMGNVLLEAMASRKPVIGSDLPGIREVIKHKFNGFLFDVGNDVKLSEYLTLLIENDDLYEKMAANAQKDVQDRFSISNHTHATVDFYKRVLSR